MMHESDLCYTSISVHPSVSRCVTYKKKRKGKKTLRAELGWPWADSQTKLFLFFFLFLPEETLTDYQEQGQISPSRVRYLF